MILDSALQTQFSLNQYSKAVANLRSQIESPCRKPAIDMVLLACLLLTCFEILQGDTPTAMGHLRTGLRIIFGHYKASLALYAHYSSAIVLKGAPNSLMDELLAVFARLDYVS